MSISGFVLRSPLSTVCSIFGSFAEGLDLSGSPGFVLWVPPGSTPSIASFPVVRDDEWPVIKLNPLSLHLPGERRGGRRTLVS